MPVTKLTSDSIQDATYRDLMIEVMTTGQEIDRRELAKAELIRRQTVAIERFNNSSTRWSIALFILGVATLILAIVQVVFVQR